MRRADGLGSGSWTGLVLLLAVVLATGVAPEGMAASSPAASEPTGGEWGPVTLPAEPPVDLTVPGDWPNGLPLLPRFLLWRSDGGSLEAAAAGLAADPPVELRAIGPTEGGLALEPAEPLVHATVYRLSARDPDGRLLGSWTFVTQGPPEVVGSIPGRWSEEVPVTTGIELTFDQPGIADLTPYWSIDPPVEGRFERLDRTVTFVPDAPLRPRTDYTVTLRAGLPVEATGEVLAADWQLPFLTAGPRTGRIRQLGEFPRSVTESATADPPLLEFRLWRTRVGEAPVEVHRLRSLEDAVAAIRGAGTAWEGGEATFPTDGLERVLSFSGAFRRSDPFDRTSRTLALPERLSPGWYVVSVRDPGGDAQVLLQVSDLAVYAHLTITRSAVWVNDLATRGPVAGATVRLVGGDRLGATGPDGLLVADTPAAIGALDEPPILLVRAGGRVVLVPFGAGGWSSRDVMPYPEDRLAGDRDADWTLLLTDRTRYRTTDTINTWGLIRERDSDAVPADVSLRLVRWADDDAFGRPLTAWEGPLTPTEFGTFSAEVPVVDLPTGDYALELRDGGAVVDQAGLTIAVIVKPTYRLSVGTDRRVAIAGEPVGVTATATFFDGTHTPGVPLAFWSDTGTRHDTTDLRGQATTTLTATIEPYEGQWSTMTVGARATRGEEGEIETATDVLVFRSSVVLRGEATIEGGSAHLDGDLSSVDRRRLEREYDRAFELAFDPRGERVDGGRVTARVIEETTVRTRTGSRYDYITKQVEPIYRWDTHERTVLVRTLTTDARGAFAVDFPVTKGHGYRVVLRAADAQGRITTEEVWAQRREGGVENVGIYLSAPGSTWDWFWSHVSLPIGGSTTVEMRSGDRLQPRGGANRYLWITGQRGLRSARVSAAPRVGVTMRGADVPLVEVSGVRFTGTTYLAAPDGFAVDFDPAGRALTVTVTPARDRYGPGEAATLEVVVENARGEPVVADVTLRAVDEKLYAIGAAREQDPLGDLYRSVWPGTLATYASHQVPGFEYRGEGGDEGTSGGGEPRADFRDQVLFRTVRTGRDGHATVTFDLSDDLTSWHVAATAISRRLQVGEGGTLLPVGLPFFVDVVMPSELLQSDLAGIRVRAFGSGLQQDGEVTVTVEAPTLGMEPTTVTVAAFEEAVVMLPALTLGSHPITVAASTAGGGGRELRDALTRTLTVVPTRLTEARAAFLPLERVVTPEAGDGIHGYLVTDAGRGAAIPVLLDLAASGGTRADRVLAAAEARRRAIELGIVAATLPAAPLGLAQFQDGGGGLALLPYGGADLELSARVALVAPDQVDRTRLGGWLRARLSRARDRGPRSAEVVALAGLAGLGEQVLQEIREAAADTSLTATSLSWLGLAAAAAGDDATARTIERRLLAELGQQQPPYVRMLGPAGNADSELTARVGLLAAWLGDTAIADGCARYVAVDPPTTTLLDLERLGIALHQAAHAPAAEARFAVTVRGERREVTLEPGGSWSLTLLPSQVEGLRFEPLGGAPALAMSWAAPLDPDAVTDDPGIDLRRRVSPAPPIDSSALVTVRLKLRLSAAALPGCYLVTELVPSGLVPVAQIRGWRDTERAVRPWRIDGQRVTFCAFRDPKHPVLNLRYTARVVAPGTFTWEPALVQSMDAPGQRELGPAGTVVLR